MEKEIIVHLLRRASAEIANEGHKGWGNICFDAADMIESIFAQLVERDREIAALKQRINSPHWESVPAKTAAYGGPDDDWNY